MTKPLRKVIATRSRLENVFTKKAHRKVREHLKNITIIVVDSIKRSDKNLILIWTPKISSIIKLLENYETVFFR